MARTPKRDPKARPARAPKPGAVRRPHDAVATRRPGGRRTGSPEEPAGTLTITRGDETFTFRDRLPLLPLRDVVVFPYMTIPLLVGRMPSINAIEKAVARDRMLFVDGAEAQRGRRPRPRRAVQGRHRGARAPAVPPARRHHARAGRGRVPLPGRALPVVERLLHREDRADRRGPAPRLRDRGAHAPRAASCSTTTCTSTAASRTRCSPPRTTSATRRRWRTPSPRTCWSRCLRSRSCSRSRARWSASSASARRSPPSSRS